MRAISITIIAVLLFSIIAGVVVTSHRPGDEPDGDRVTEKLYSIDRRVSNKATGSIVLHLGQRRRDASRLEVKARLRSLPAGVSRIYRLWVVDDFVGDGVLIKTFRTDKKGDIDFRAHKFIRDVSKFRRFVVTIESRRLRRQSDSFTHGPTVMEGTQPLEGD